mgnify:CR=1 FL=1
MVGTITLHFSFLYEFVLLGLASAKQKPTISPQLATEWCESTFAICYTMFWRCMLSFDCYSDSEETSFPRDIHNTRSWLDNEIG